MTAQRSGCTHIAVGLVLLLASLGCAVSPKEPLVSPRTWPAVGTAGDESRAEVAVLGSESEIGPERLAALRLGFAQANSVGRADQALMLANLGVAALHSGCSSLSRPALRMATIVMNSIIYDPDLYKRITAPEGEEFRKVFCGEPHERAAIDVYLGIVYLSYGQYERARACFRRARRQLPKPDENDAITDTLAWLADVADRRCRRPMRLGGHRSDGVGVDAGGQDEEADTLIVVAVGSAPRKIARFSLDEVTLTYAEPDTDVNRVELIITCDGDSGAPDASGRQVQTLRRLHVFESALWYRRAMDRVLSLKRQREMEARQAGKILEEVATGLSGVPYGGWVAWIFALLAGGARSAAAIFDPLPDFRTVTELPSSLFLGVVEWPCAPRCNIVVELYAGDILIDSVSLPRNLPKPDRGMRVVVVRAADARWPGAVALP